MKHPGIRVAVEPKRTLPARVKEALHGWCFHRGAERWMAEVTAECPDADPECFAAVADRFVTLD